MSTTPYFVTIYEQQNPARSVTARLGAPSGTGGQPTPSLGGGGWKTIILTNPAAVFDWRRVRA